MEAEREQTNWRPSILLLMAVAFLVVGSVGARYRLMTRLQDWRSPGQTPQFTQSILAQQGAAPIQGIDKVRRDADAGDAAAQNALGDLYDEGRGVPQDLPAAIEWYRKSAAQNFAFAENNLGYAYEHGLGVLQDYSQ